MSGFVQNDAAQANCISVRNVDPTIGDARSEKMLQGLCHSRTGFPCPDHSYAIEISQPVAPFRNPQRRSIDLHMGEHGLPRIGGANCGAENSEGVGAAHGIGSGEQRQRQNARHDRGRVVFAGLDPVIRKGVGGAALIEQLLHADGVARQGAMGFLRNPTLNHI